MKVKGYDTMQVLEKLTDKIIKMKFANIVYVLITSMTLVSSTKLIKEGYDRDMHTKTLVHVATEKKICDIKKHFGVMILEYVKNKTSNDLTNESTAIVEMTIPKINEMLNNQASEKHEVLNNQASEEKEEEKTSQSITISESITHGKSGTESHIMKLINQMTDRKPLH
jgi:hypothetical protein